MNVRKIISRFATERALEDKIGRTLVGTIATAGPCTLYNTPKLTQIFHKEGRTTHAHTHTHTHTVRRLRYSRRLLGALVGRRLDQYVLQVGQRHHDVLAVDGAAAGLAPLLLQEGDRQRSRPARARPRAERVLQTDVVTLQRHTG